MKEISNKLEEKIILYMDDNSSEGEFLSGIYAHGKLQHEILGYDLLKTLDKKLIELLKGIRPINERYTLDVIIYHEGIEYKCIMYIWLDKLKMDNLSYCIGRTSLYKGLVVLESDKESMDYAENCCKEMEQFI